MSMVRVFLRTVPIVLLLVGCATAPPAKRTELAATRYDLGVAYFDAGHFRRAIPEFAKAVELSPSDPVYHTALGMALMFTKNLDQAIREFEAAIQADARFSEAKNNLASAYMLKGDLEKARALLVQVLDDPFYPTPQFAYFNLARIYERQGKVNRAIAEYRRALDITRDYVEAHNNLGFLYLQQGKTDLAIKEFSEATHLSPKVAIYQRNLGAAYYQAGNRGKARKAFEKVVELEPDSPSAAYARKMLEQLK